MDKQEIKNLIESASSLINQAKLDKDSLQAFLADKRGDAIDEFSSAVYHVAAATAHTFHYAEPNESDFAKFEQELQYAISDMIKATICDYYIRNGVY